MKRLLSAEPGQNFQTIFKMGHKHIRRIDCINEQICFCTSAVTVGKFLAISRRRVPVLMSHSSRGLSLNTTTRYCLRTDVTNRLTAAVQLCYFFTCSYDNLSLLLMSPVIGFLRILINGATHTTVSPDHHCSAPAPPCLTPCSHPPPPSPSPQPFLLEDCDLWQPG